MSVNKKPLKPDDFPVSADGKKIKKQDGTPAMRDYERHHTPFVFFCDLSPDLIVAEYNGRGEHELIVDPRSFFGRAILDVGDCDTVLEANEMTGYEDVPLSAIAD